MRDGCALQGGPCHFSTEAPSKPQLPASGPPAASSASSFHLRTLQTFGVRYVDPASLRVPVIQRQPRRYRACG
jgi:hypothetical protein